MPASILPEADAQERLRLVGEVFRPAAPIDRRSLFSGRFEQIGELFAIVGQPGQHAVIYGERGVGKTSLAVLAATAYTLGREVQASTQPSVCVRLTSSPR